MLFLRYAALVVATWGAVMASVSATDAKTAGVVAQPERTHLRGLLDKLVSSDASAAPVQEIAATWEDGKVGESRQLRAITDKIVGGEMVVVFNDRKLSPEAKAESAVVAFDIRSSANCVVSVCGELSNWYLGSKEQCFDLRIAQKSSDEHENGLIRGVSAAYSGKRPVAKKLYLKFDETNFIDGSACEYEILSGTKTVHEDDDASGSLASTS
ncbi:hypothetical protein BBJ28_00016239 [Nothophytophthora sp. Chile5]|nr:hypothetical protein BBJ28_00016239 [Nothophytophthora sp. Chile5]